MNKHQTWYHHELGRITVGDHVHCVVDNRSGWAEVTGFEYASGEWSPSITVKYIHGSTFLTWEDGPAKVYRDEITAVARSIPLG